MCEGEGGRVLWDGVCQLAMWDAKCGGGVGK